MKDCGIRKAIEVLGGTNIEVHKGFHYQYGFFDWNGQLYYFSTGDDRWPEVGCAWDRMPDELDIMYRTAQHRTDWTGGVNTWDFLSKLHKYGYKLTKKPATKERF